jgi:hypothetical protein
MLSQCYSILSNLSAHSAHARVEIHKYKLFDIVSRSFQTQVIFSSNDAMKTISWFLRNATQELNPCNLKCPQQSVIIGAMIDLLYSNDQEIET